MKCLRHTGEQVAPVYERANRRADRRPGVWAAKLGSDDVGEEEVEEEGGGGGVELLQTYA